MKFCIFLTTALLLCLHHRGRSGDLLSLVVVDAFQPSPPLRVTRFDYHCDWKTTSKRFLSSRSLPSPLEKDVDHAEFADDDDDDVDCRIPTSPAAVFGRPLDQFTRDRNKQFIHTLKSVLFDTMFAGTTIDRAYARFYALETIARVPYFSYLSVLHLLETVGIWRRAEYLKVHFCESWNELHHLLIMEELGGSKQWSDRFVAQHIAFVYYWTVVVLYLFNPTHAYNLNQAVEEEAYETYHAFLQQHAEYLQSQPAPLVAQQYYAGDNLYLFDSMHLSRHTDDDSAARGAAPAGDAAATMATTGTTTGSTSESSQRRRPAVRTLYDCFVAIRDDEAEHVKTMAFLQEDSCL